MALPNGTDRNQYMAINQCSEFLAAYVMTCNGRDILITDLRKYNTGSTYLVPREARSDHDWSANKNKTDYY
eukprot:3542765-Ditylum_brightwellii.AAC.1